MGLYGLTAHEIRDMLRLREISAKDVLDDTFERIKQTENKINAYITITGARAYEAAERFDKAMAAGEPLGDLAGIPMALKDNLCTAGIKTTCASKILDNFIPPYSCEVYGRLDREGAVLVGKTNLDEFAMGSSTESSYYKPTRNPWDTGRVPGGSSGGSAAAVAAGEAFFALGSDTGGSVRQPAALCGVVGFKPTYGTVSRYGLVAFASSLDQIGPITRDVEDCALVMNCISGYDPKDSTSLVRDSYDYKNSLVNDVKGLRIGIPKEYFGKGINSGVAEMVEKAAKKFEDMGAYVEETSLPHTAYALAAYCIIAFAEASSNLARYDGVRYGLRAEKFGDLDEMYKKSRSESFGDEVKRRIMLGTYTLSSGYYDAYYGKAVKVRTLIRQDFDRAFEKYDILVSPAAPSTAFEIGEKSNSPVSMYQSDICTVPVNIAGNTAISIPCGLVNGLPVGMQIIGKPMDEKTVIRAAYTFEKNTGLEALRPELRPQDQLNERDVYWCEI